MGELTDESCAAPGEIAATNERIRQLLAALPDYDSPAFWPTVTAQGDALPTEVLVHVLQAHRVRGRAADVERAAELLIGRAYSIARDIVGRCLRSRSQDDREDAVREAFAIMWRRLSEGDTFWGRNFLGALHAACVTACRPYYAKKRSHV